MTKSNFLLINRKPQVLEEVIPGEKGLIFLGKDRRILDHGVLVMDSGVRACLYCDDVRNLTFLVNRPGAYGTETLIFAAKEKYEKVRDAIKKDYPKLEMSPQNKKLNRYAERLMEKLKDGQEVRIVDAVRAEDVIICPECGVQCAPGSQYCMECGAELPQK